MNPSPSPSPSPNPSPSASQDPSGGLDAKTSVDLSTLEGDAGKLRDLVRIRARLGLG